MHVKKEIFICKKMFLTTLFLTAKKTNGRATATNQTNNKDRLLDGKGNCDTSILWNFYNRLRTNIFWYANFPQNLQSEKRKVQSSMILPVWKRIIYRYSCICIQRFWKNTWKAANRDYLWRLRLWWEGDGNVLFHFVICTACVF